jgi:hypothetical protein
MPPNAGKGRPKGALNKTTKAMREFLADLAADPEVRAAIKEKIKSDPSMMRELLARTEGKVPDVLHIETPAPLVVDLVTGPQGEES